MVLSRQLITALNSPFSKGREEFISISPSNSYTLDRSNIFSVGLKIDVSKRDIEVPTVFTNYSYEFRVYNKYSELIIPLYSTRNYTITVKNFLSCIKELFLRSTGRDRCVIIKDAMTNKRYYGFNGLILDEAYTPLVFCTNKVRYNENISDSVYRIYNIYKNIVRINPIIYSDEENPFYQKIIKKIIPAYSSRRVFTSFPLEVIIGDMSDFFYKTSTPRCTSGNQNINNEINTFLQTHLELVNDFE